MNSDEFKQARKVLNLDNAEMAKLCNVSIRTIERWRAGSVVIPGTAERLVEVYVTLHASWPSAYDYTVGAVA